MNLKVLNFDWGKCLTKIPDNVYGLSNLEELAFKHCKDVVRVHNSIGFLDKLVSFVEEIIKNRGEKRDNTYAEEIELFYSNSNCSQQRYNK